MANLPETPQWEDGIYQIEVSDPVLGGPDGISNRQAKQLASRTSYLKQQVEKGGSDLAKHIAAADPHTQYATKASPTFTGTPTAPTPAANDNSKKLVTTEFVARAIAALAGTAPETLDTLKELADALGNDPNFATTVLNKLAEKLAKDQNGADIPDKAAFLQNLGLGEGAKLGAAVCVTGSTGYMTIPAMVAGKERVIILQWFGAATADYVTPVTANFPIAFPNECMIPLFSDVATGAVDLSSTAAYNLAAGRSYYTAVTRTQITCAGYGGFRVFAIGW
ncbi:phage tail protein [Escherichia coli]|uniref:gp53-like domain-containing protein n=1 Tax=Escherichia coli TaxID=562 RepID=UPI002115A63D|nr:phage tail protein [Escherichia coli]MCQ7025628.1 phage tail protein [Escherichia coli]